jgi:Tol biopolymer transport system component
MRQVAVLSLLVVVVAAGCGSSRGREAPPLLAYSNGVDIVLYDPVAGTRRTLARGRVPSEYDGDTVLALSPAWSADGRRLAYVRFGRVTRIEVVEVASGVSRRVSHRLGDRVSGYGLRWSADGRWLAYRDQDAGELWLARSDGGGERLVVRAPRAGRRLGIIGWTGRGRLAFRTAEGQFTVDPDGGRAVRLRGGFAPPTRAPAGGARLAVVRDRAGNDQVVVEALSGRRLGALTADRSLPGRTAVRSRCPRWSPDGRWVAFVRAGAVVVVSAAAGRERRVLEDAAIAGWSPDGRYLLVARSLGRRSLWLFEPGTRRLTRIVAAPQLGGAAWRPSPPPRVVPVAAPTLALARTVETPWPSSSFRPGRMRIGAVRPVPAAARANIADLTADGRLAAVRLPTGHPYSYRLGVLDLDTGTVRRFGVAATPLSWDNTASFDRTGSRLLYRHWHELLSLSVRTGRARLLAHDAGAGPFRWLRDGGIAYTDSRGRLVIRGADATRRRYQLPPQALRSAAIAPNGERLLYTSGCDVWLANIRSGKVRRFAHASYSPTRLSWSPTGSQVALASSWWADCDRDFDWYHASTALFDQHGRELDQLAGATVGWSPDGRFLLTSGGVTGTQTATLHPLLIDDLRHRRTSTLLASGSTGTGFVDASGGIVFARYDAPAATREPREDHAWRLYHGRLIDSRRDG